MGRSSNERGREHNVVLAKRKEKEKQSIAVNKMENPEIDSVKYKLIISYCKVFKTLG